MEGSGTSSGIGMAQWLVQLSGKRKVPGSNPGAVDIFPFLLFTVCRLGYNNLQNQRTVCPQTEQIQCGQSITYLTDWETEWISDYFPLIWLAKYLTSIYVFRSTHVPHLEHSRGFTSCVKATIIVSAFVPNCQFITICFKKIFYIYP